MAHVLEHWFQQVPIVTRCYLTATVLTTISCSLEIVTPLTLYLNPKLVFGELQLWRLVTNCLYLGKLDLRFFLRMYYMAEYSKELEERAFRGRTADFAYMIFFGAMVMTGIVVVGSLVPYVSGSFVGIYFLSDSLIFMMVLLALSILAGGNAWGNLVGMVAGHAFYFLEEVYPRMTGRRPLRTPSFIQSLFARDEAVVRPAANVRFAPARQEELVRND